MNRFKRIYGFIRDHPLGSRHRVRAITNWIAWQVRSHLAPGPHTVPFVGDFRLLVSRGMHGATGNIYCGLHEFADMAFIMHFLKPGDLFVDVGANIGSYTILASGLCRARTLAIEPVAKTADALEANIELNGLGGLVRVARCAVGETSGTVQLSHSLDCMNHVLTEGEQVDAVEVPSFRLDELLDGEQPALLKVDVEGYEYAMLRGAQDTLSHPGLLAVIVELNGSGQRYGHADYEVFELLGEHGFERFTYDPFQRLISGDAARESSTDNTLFVRDAGSVRERLSSAPQVVILGEKL